MTDTARDIGSRASDADAPLRVSDVTVSYGGILAISDVTFGVPRGTIVGLIGPNGAGKTTLFDAICGFTSVENGRVELEGRDITRLAPAERSRAGLGRSFQDAKLFGSLTVGETLACAFERKVSSQGPVSAALGMPWVWSTERSLSKRVDELTELLGLGAFYEKFVSELSTGSRRIVDLACVLAHDPSVLLLDEPSSGIAQRETEALGPLLLRIREVTGCTMLLVEHDMPLVTSVSDELIALETGRVIARGTPGTVTKDPLVIESYLGTDERVVARSGSAVARKARGNSKRATATRKTRAAGKTAKGKAKSKPKPSTRRRS
jgi:branched-chain amino acid transport system ATP-binding protein